MKKDITKKIASSKMKKPKARTRVTKEPTNKDYISVLHEVKQQIQEAQTKAMFSVNKELLKLYWWIGKTITEQQKINGWGSKSVEKLAEDIQKEFPGIEGFSVRNIFRMQAFFEAYQILPQAATVLDMPIFNIPWFHNVIIIQRLKSTEERMWYAQKAIECGWSRSVLEMWIESKLFHRQGKAITNFKKSLPSPDSDMAQQTLKDPYTFGFLTLANEAQELEVEQGLIDHIQKFLLELGQGFAFIGRQYHLKVSSKDLYLDMLFYHMQLRCYIVVELKAKEFDARDVGQINLYLSAVDNILKHPGDSPTIGLLLCKSKDNLIVEYALQDFNKPIGVASHTTKLVESLPKEFKGKLPTIAEIESGLEKIEQLKVNAKPMKRKPAAKKSKK